MNQADIENVGAQTIGEVLTNVPSITGLGNSGRGGNGNGGSGASVYIHQIGASAQNSTLVLLDGHRIPVSGTTNSVVDPNNFPQIMLERVDVLAEGASSVYGSDAVAGVVNFVTRKKFDGLEVRTQAQLEQGASTGKLISVLTGKSWDTGNFLVAYSYSFEDNIPFSSRWETNPLIQGQRALQNGFPASQIFPASGAPTTNFGNFNCDPATIQPTGSSNIYLNAQGSAFVSSAANNQMCSTWANSDYVPSETRQNSMFRFNEDIVKNPEPQRLTAPTIPAARYRASPAALSPQPHSDRPTTPAIPAPSRSPRTARRLQLRSASKIHSTPSRQEQPPQPPSRFAMISTSCLGRAPPAPAATT